MLAICCKNGSIQLMRRYDDPAPILIRTGLCPIYMEWANSKELLCVAGSRPGRLNVNIVQIYSDTGQLVYSIKMPYSSVSIHLKFRILFTYFFDTLKSNFKFYNFRLK